jgi:hypothetical protein
VTIVRAPKFWRLHGHQPDRARPGNLDQSFGTIWHSLYRMGERRQGLVMAAAVKLTFPIKVNPLRNTVYLVNSPLYQ